MYIIIGKYKSMPYEELDAFDTFKEASAMLAEYRLAYGSGWSLDIKHTKCKCKDC